MIWVIRIIALSGLYFFAQGLIARIPSPYTYGGERLANQLMLWLIGFLIECVAAGLYLFYRIG